MKSKSKIQCPVCWQKSMIAVESTRMEGMIPELKLLQYVDVYAVAYECMNPSRGHRKIEFEYKKKEN